MSPSIVNANQGQCRLYPNFENYLKSVHERERVDRFSQYFNVNSFREIIIEAFGHPVDGGEISITEKEIELHSELFIVRSIWVDSRIHEVITFKEICDGNQGELILKYRNIYGKKVYRLIRFVLEDDQWKLGPPYISKVSKILEKRIEDILE